VSKAKEGDVLVGAMKWKGRRAERKGDVQSVLMK